MSLTVNCCDNLRIKNLLCGCMKDEEPEEDKRHDQIMYTDAHRNIAVISTPKVDIPEMVILSHLDATDIHTFVRDPEQKIILVSVQGVNMFRTDQDIKESKYLQGKLAEECLPEYACKFLMPIYQQTMEGHPVTLTVLWGGVTSVIRTFLILGQTDSKVVGGVLTCSPYTIDFNGDINRFIVESTGDRKKPDRAKDKIRVPPVQKMA